MGTGIGAGIARLRSKRKVNPDETPEERQQRIRKATKKGALVGGGIGTGAGTINAIRNIRAYASNDQIRRNKISELEKSIKKLRKYN